MNDLTYDAELLAEFECIVCTEYMHPPIKMCSSGHSSVCNDCLPTVTVCPSCKSQLLDTRNFTLEKVHNQLIFPCNIDGCDENFKGSLVKDHKQTCKFSKKPCPLFLFGECKWMGNMDNLVEHSELAHPFNLSRDEMCYRKLSEDNYHPPDYRLRSLRFIKVLFNVFNEIFIFTLKSVDIGLERTLYWCVFLLSKPKENNFYFQIKFENDIKQKLVLSGPCVVTDWIRGNNFDSFKKQCVTASSGILEKSDFDEYSVRIYRNN